MATTNQFNRANVKAVVLSVTKANGTVANAATAKLPLGAIIADVAWLTATAFNGTTPTGSLTLVDNAASPVTTTLVSAEDVTSTGAETVDITASAAAVATGGTLKAFISAADATAGQAYAVVQYVEANGSNEVYG